MDRRKFFSMSLAGLAGLLAAPFKPPIAEAAPATHECGRHTHFRVSVKGMTSATNLDKVCELIRRAQRRAGRGSSFS
jgi:hypothetical protein